MTVRYTREIKLTLTDEEHLRLAVLLLEDRQAAADKHYFKDRSVDVAGLYSRVMDAWVVGVPK